MNSSKAKFTWLLISGAFVFMLVQFQNCGTAGTSPQNSSSPDKNSNQARIVDDWNQKSIAFPESFVQLHDAASTYTAHGLCKGNDGIIHWKLLKAEMDPGSAVSSGEVACESSGFQVSFEDMGTMNCGEGYVLEARDSQANLAQIHILRKCPPLLAEQSYVNESSSEACYFELDRTNFDSDPVCFEACYVGDLLAFRERVDRKKCGTQALGSNN